MNLAGASILAVALLTACGGTLSDPVADDAASDAAPDANADHATSIVCVFAAGPLSCGDWVSVDTIDFELVDGGKKFNHETPCSSGVCVGTSCGVPDDAGVIVAVGTCETIP